MFVTMFQFRWIISSVSNVSFDKKRPKDVGTYSQRRLEETRAIAAEISAIGHTIREHNNGGSSRQLDLFDAGIQ